MQGNRHALRAGITFHYLWPDNYDRTRFVIEEWEKIFRLHSNNLGNGFVEDIDAKISQLRKSLETGYLRKDVRSYVFDIGNVIDTREYLQEVQYAPGLWMWLEPAAYAMSRQTGIYSIEGIVYPGIELECNENSYPLDHFVEDVQPSLLDEARKVFGYSDLAGVVLKVFGKEFSFFTYEIRGCFTGGYSYDSCYKTILIRKLVNEDPAIPPATIIPEIVFHHRLFDS